MEDSAVFCHLNTKTEYSLLDGSVKICDLLDKLKALGHSYASLTDHGNMFGAVEFYQECNKRGISAILGSTLYISISDHVRDFLNDHAALLPESMIKQLPASFHLTLLAKNHQGYRRLIRLVSAAYEQGLVDDIPVCSYALLKQHLGSKPCDDLIAISSGHMGEIAYLLTLKQHLLVAFPALSASSSQEADKKTDDRHDVYKALLSCIDQSIQCYASLFAKEHFYLEMVDNGIAHRENIHKDLVSLAERCEIGCVATASSYYLDVDDYENHLLAVAIKNTLTERDISQRKSGCSFHLLSNKDFLECFSSYPTAIKNTLSIAHRCKIQLDFTTSHLPSFITGTDDAAKKEDQLLVQLSEEGLKRRLQHPADTLENYHIRLTYEIGVIKEMGFSGYFLIVQDFINWAKKQRIAVGPGRGSGAGSLVAFVLGITDIDPIRWGLIFERFLNPERISLPDFDVDFCQWRREEVIQYVINKYSADKVAYIATFGRLQAKAAVKNVARVLGMSFMKMNRITKMFPPDIGLSLDDVLAKTPQIRDMAQRDEQLSRVIEAAQKLEGMVSHTSVHPAGIIIADRSITDYVPTFKTSRDNCMMSQYEMKKLEQVGLVKFDFLGLKTLSVIDRACGYICATQDSDFDIEHISLDDQDVYEYLSAGRTAGIFQAESSGMTSLCQKMKPNSFSDIIALVALFRPGPLGSGMVDNFIERKHLRQAITYLHPSLEPILQETYGMIVYQEQVQKIAASLAHYSLGEADLLRRAMGKKISAEMQQQKQRFTSGCVKKGIDEDLAIKIFDLMAEFANYGFNKSHSAAYGLILYQTAYLKFHYPWAFMMGIMTCDKDHPQKIRRYIDECLEMNIRVKPPCINASFQEFEVNENKDILFAFEAIKGFGKKSSATIVRERNSQGKFTSIIDLAQRLDLQAFGKKNVEILIKAGAMDCFGFLRKDLLASLDKWVHYSQYVHSKRSSGQQSLFSMSSHKLSSSHLETSLPWYASLKNRPADDPTEVADLIEEKKLLGTYLSSHPMHFYEAERLFLAPQETLKSVRDRCSKTEEHGSDEMIIVAFLADQFQKITQSQTMMAQLRLEDESTSMECVIFDKAIKACTYWPLSNHSFVYVRGYIPRGEHRSFVINTIEPIEKKLASDVCHMSFEWFCGKKSHEYLHTSFMKPFFASLKTYAHNHPGSVKMYFVADFLDGSYHWDLGISCSIKEYETFKNITTTRPPNVAVSFASRVASYNEDREAIEK
ncbi:MAG: DNA polymerase III subunit alpha [Proteobacteria bacterium]|nr:DNA polymerase III subunit alpha [Pseudomonadota bacterium]